MSILDTIIGKPIYNDDNNILIFKLQKTLTKNELIQLIINLKDIKEIKDRELNYLIEFVKN